MKYTAETPEEAKLDVAETPVCPLCGEPVNELFTTARITLEYVNGKWVRDEMDNAELIHCSQCYEELGGKELDKLRVPNNLR